jgi:hypothetical protein
MSSYVTIRSLLAAFGTLKDQLIKHFLDHSMHVNYLGLIATLGTSPLSVLGEIGIHTVVAVG